MNTKSYRCCAVPMCTNTSIKTPDKLFVFMPYKKEIRDKWLKLARRDLTGILPTTQLYFCEDHFDLPNVMENYMEYHIMGSVSQIRMKPGCLPTKFTCQTDRGKRTFDITTKRKFAFKKERKLLIEECEKEINERKNVDLKHLELGEASCGSSVLQENISQDTQKTKNKSIQVHISNKFRSKAVQTNINLVKQSTSASSSPFKLPLDALICQPCFLLLDTEAGEHERLLGHTMVCVGCGKSVRRIKQYHNVNMECPLLAVLISQNTYYVPSRNNYVCHMCWIRANRQAVVDSTHDMQELASDNMQDLASNNNAAAPPDVQEDRVNAILVNVYKYFATEGTELSPSQLRERTALCTGASEADVECALVLHQEVSATQKPLRKPPRKRRKKESKSPPPIQEEEPYIERETLIVTVDPKAGDANSEINPLAIKEEQPSSPITCEQDASLCEPQQSGLKPEDMAKVFVKTEPTEEPNS
ncbi:uncharacterized protein LOC118278943 isoform X11 [Spodoptera frugiperda]|uniref:Uncharacterized protein LOC118278943 isoform X11 n=1 Tax=Spodoptera frugiperda TaxID=7108 RepID=A0A9R0E6X7_SPOFR|nr:uncharacterized protein LOC118278943 isoform X11 [Spodoptera frugiperda]